MDEDRMLSFEQAHRAYFGTIYNLVYRLVGDEDVAKDLVQDTFVAAYRGWDQRQKDTRVSTWLHQVAVNTCLNYHR